MALEVTTTVPTLESFTTLSEHQSQTPGTFFGARPVLHYHSPGAKLVVSRAQYDSTSVLHEIDDLSVSQNGDGNGASIAELGDVVLRGIDVWVTSQDLILFSPSKRKGFAIPYPSIALHALGTHDSTPSIYLQLNLHDADLVNAENDYDVDTLDIHLVPTSSTIDPSTDPPFPPAKAIFEALSACADLHPDPNSPGSDGEGEEEDTAPGAGGWITSENMHEFIDGDGNFVGVGGAGLGAGAGTVREREEDNGEEINGDHGGDGDSKWQRTG